MSDSRFFRNQGPFPLTHIITITGVTAAPGCNLNLQLHDVAPLDRAGENDISFFDNTKYIDSFTASKAGACFVRAKHVAIAPAGMTLLVSEDPYYCYALAAQQFYPSVSAIAEISPHAHIHPHAKIGKDVRIEAGAVIEEHVEIGDGSSVGAHAVIRRSVIIGSQCFIGSGSSISHALIGNRVLLHPGVHIGQDGFGFAMSKDGHAKIPQLGRVLIDDDVEVGAGTCIDRGTGPDTTIGMGTKIDNLVQIGHNVVIGKHCIIVAQAGIAGSTRVGDGVVLGGQVGISGHVKIGSGARIAAQSGIISDIPTGAAYGGSPAVPVKEWHRQTVALSRLTRKKVEP